MVSQLSALTGCYAVWVNEFMFFNEIRSDDSVCVCVFWYIYINEDSCQSLTLDGDVGTFLDVSGQF